MRRRELLQAGTALFSLPALSLHAKSSRYLRAAPASASAAGQPDLPVWAYEAQVPGPVLRYRRGEVLDLELHNALPDPTTIHWHGIRLPNAMDGVPGLTQDAVAPGQRFHYRFALPDAGTYWYHPHWGTPEQLERGLAGALIVEDDEPPPVDRDLVWLLDDWRLDAQGRIAENFYNFHDVAHAGRMGQRLTVNGQTELRQTLRAGERVRLRLINAANARIFALSFEGLPAWLIARDGMPADTAVPWEGELLLGPGMRADFILDASAPGRHALKEVDRRGERVLATLEVSGTPDSGAARPVPRPAPYTPLPEPDLASAHAHTLALGGGAMNREGWPQESVAEREARRLRLQAGAREAAPAWTINGQAHLQHSREHAAHAAEFRVPRGRSVRLRIDNRTAWWHPMHLHGHHFRVLSRNGTPLPERPWRDTVLMAPRDSVEIAFVADNPGWWLLHCHVLEHHAGGLGTLFEVQG
ncbi:MAG: multicopper oxidase family protein [Hylemonella sp.]|uniref:multicopper oxidase family protein n=1 Tax=Hylemonella sp. TaxID=2066020 RepID=UPI00391D4194